MNYKLLKLNLKIAYLKIFRKLNKINKTTRFGVNELVSPSILVVFPINSEEIVYSLEAISGIVNSQSERDTKFSFILNSNIEKKISLSDIDIHNLIVYKNEKIDNVDKIVDRIFFKKFDIIIDLNINFNLDIALMVNRLESTYKIGFSSKYSDLFYNIQISESGKNPYNYIEEIIG